MARLNLIEYMNHHGFDCLDMSRIILTLASVRGSIVRIVDNPTREILRP